MCTVIRKHDAGNPTPCILRRSPTFNTASSKRRDEFRKESANPRFQSQHKSGGQNEYQTVSLPPPLSHFNAIGCADNAKQETLSFPHLYNPDERKLSFQSAFKTMRK